MQKICNTKLRSAVLSGSPVWGREGDAPKMRRGGGEGNAHFAFAGGFLANMDNAAVLFFGDGPVSKDYLLARLYLHSQVNERAVGVDDQSGGFLGDGGIALKLSANLNGNLQEDALGAAPVGGVACRAVRIAR